MKASYHLISAKTNQPCQFNESFKKISERPISGAYPTKWSYQSFPGVSTFSSQIPEVSKNKPTGAKLPKFLNRLTQFFILNKANYVNGSKNCDDEFIYYNSGLVPTK
jgi:hypothetical protein